MLRSHGAALVLFARQWCSDPDDALQDALIDLTHLARAPNDPVAWLFTATKRRALNQARGEARRKRRDSIAAQQMPDFTWFDCEFERREESQSIQNALSKLPLEERQILVMRIWGNLSFSQIADVVETSSSTVHRRYLAALDEMKRLLDFCQESQQAVPRSNSYKNNTFGKY